MTDLRTLGNEKNWVEIDQDRLRWSTFCEYINSSTGVRGVCAAAEPAPTQIFVAHVDIHFGTLET